MLIKIVMVNVMGPVSWMIVEFVLEDIVDIFQIVIKIVMVIVLDLPFSMIVLFALKD